MGYDQSVTCLADDPRNLETRSNRRRTPGILSQTNGSIYKQSLKRNKEKSRKDPKNSKQAND